MTTPAVLGRYEIGAEIGRGMMGIVYKAIDPALSRVVAVKVVSPAIPLPEPDRRRLEERFLREATLAAALSHPNIVVVYDVGYDQATHIPFIALEYLEGRSLAQVLAEGPALEWRDALSVAASLADALQHAQSRGIVHRDVKPSNIIVLPSGEPKILDFGIAKALATDLTAAGEFWGSPAYMSPEQASGYLVDGRSDLFSLASVLYELLTGRRAFLGAGIVETMYQLVNNDPPRLSLLRRGMPAALDDVLARALAKDPAERYPDGRTFGEALRRVLRDEDQMATVRSMVETHANTTVVPPHGLRALAAAGLVALVALVALLGLSVRSGSPTAPPTLAPLSVPVPLPSPLGTLPPPIAPPSLDRPVRAPSASLAVTIEHSQKDLRFRLFVDNRLALDRPLVSTQTKRLLFLKKNGGTLAAVAQIAPGSHELRVTVDGEDSSRSTSLRRVFRSGEAQALRIKAGSRLEVEWVR